MTAQKAHLKIDIDNEDLLIGFLEFAQKNRCPILVELFESSIVQGFIKDISEDIVIVSNLTDDGDPDGESFFKLEDISFISCDNESLNCLKILYENTNM